MLALLAAGLSLSLSACACTWSALPRQAQRNARHPHSKRLLAPPLVCHPLCKPIHAQLCVAPGSGLSGLACGGAGACRRAREGDDSLISVLVHAYRLAVRVRARRCRAVARRQTMCWRVCVVGLFYLLWFLVRSRMSYKMQSNDDRASFTTKCSTRTPLMAPISVVAVVGAGPSGLAAAHHLADEHAVHLIDARGAVGGVWAARDEDRHYASACGHGGCREPGRHATQPCHQAHFEHAGQAYDWLVTNTPTALFPYPGFPLMDADWAIPMGCGSEGAPSSQRSLSSPYVPAWVAIAYYKRFAKEKRLHAGTPASSSGRLAGFHLLTRVESIARRAHSEHGWRLRLSCPQWRTSEALDVDRIVLAVGAHGKPSIPSWAEPLLKSGLAIHSHQLGDQAVVNKLAQARHIVVVGGGKSALDVVAWAGSDGIRSRSENKGGKADTSAHSKYGPKSRLAQRQQQPIVTILRRPGHQAPGWPLPSGKIPAWASRLSLLGGGGSFLSPWPMALPGEQNVRYGVPLSIQLFRHIYWTTLAWNTRRSYPALLAGRSSGWQALMGGAARMFPAPNGLEHADYTVIDAHVLSCDAEHVPDVRATIYLEHPDARTDQINVDESAVIVLCTGYAGPEAMLSLFEDPHVGHALGLPRQRDTIFQSCAKSSPVRGSSASDVDRRCDAAKCDKCWSDLVSEATTEAQKREPALRTLHDMGAPADSSATSSPDMRLHRLMVPFGSCPPGATRDFALIGAPQTLSAAIVADVQARWLARFFAEPPAQTTYAAETGVSGQGTKTNFWSQERRDVVHCNDETHEDTNRKERSPMLHLPHTPEDAAKAAAALVGASKARYGATDSRHGTTMSLELAFYADLLCADMHHSGRLPSQRSPWHAASSQDWEA